MSTASEVSVESSIVTTSQTTLEEYLRRVRRIIALIETEAPRAEELGHLTPAVVEAAIDVGIPWAAVSADMGGSGLDFRSTVKLLEELVCADGSTGWSLAASLAVTTIASQFLDPVGARELLAGNGERRGTACGMLTRMTDATRVDGGYRVTGHFQFGSGFVHSSWIGFGFQVRDEAGKPLLTESGLPAMHGGFLPKNKVECLGNWNVMGLEATGSYDYAIRDQFVPDKYTFDMVSGTANSDPKCNIGIPNIAILVHGGFALGCMKRALLEVCKTAMTKTRPGYATTLGASDVFQREFTRHEALYQAARELLLQAIGQLEAKALNRQQPTAVDSARLTQATTWAHEVGQEVVGFAYKWSGSAALRQSSRLGRCFRDFSVGNQHLLVDPVGFVQAAPALISHYMEMDTLDSAQVSDSFSAGSAVVG